MYIHYSPYAKQSKCSFFDYKKIIDKISCCAARTGHFNQVGKKQKWLTLTAYTRYFLTVEYVAQSYATKQHYGSPSHAYMRQPKRIGLYQ